MRDHGRHPLERHLAWRIARIARLLLIVGVIALVFGPATSSPTVEHDPTAMAAAVLAPASVVDGDVSATVPTGRRDVPAAWLVAAVLAVVLLAIGTSTPGIPPTVVARCRWFAHSLQRRGPPALVV